MGAMTTMMIPNWKAREGIKRFPRWHAADDAAGSPSRPHRCAGGLICAPRHRINTSASCRRRQSMASYLDLRAKLVIASRAPRAGSVAPPEPASRTDAEAAARSAVVDLISTGRHLDALSQRADAQLARARPPSLATLMMLVISAPNEPPDARAPPRPPPKPAPTTTTR